jgi:hypothetical protein
MPNFELLSDDTWPALASSARGHKQIHAAIAYVTSAHINFKKNDVLVCDASDKAIRGGLTSAKTIRKFFKDGAQIYSMQGLHAKIAVIDGETFIGSANMSATAGTRTKEASLFTDDLQIASAAQSFIDEVIRDPRTLEVDETFLKRIGKIEVRRPIALPELAGTTTRKSSKKVAAGRRASRDKERRQARVWFLSVTPFTEAQEKVEEPVVPALAERAAAAMKVHHDAKMDQVAKRWLSAPEDMLYIRYGAGSRIAQRLAPGDLLIVCQKSADKRRGTVYSPATYLYSEDDGRYVRVCYSRFFGEREYKWTDVQKAFKRLGVSSIKMTSQRELTGSALAILDFLHPKRS